MATSRLEKFPYCGDRHTPGEPSACPSPGSDFGVNWGSRELWAPQAGRRHLPAWADVWFQSSANRAGQGLALTNHIKPGDTFYYLAASLSSVLKVSPKQDSLSGLFARWEVKIEMGGCCKWKVCLGHIISFIKVSVMLDKAHSGTY